VSKVIATVGESLYMDRSQTVSLFHAVVITALSGYYHTLTKNTQSESPATIVYEYTSDHDRVEGLNFIKQLLIKIAEHEKNTGYKTAPFDYTRALKKHEAYLEMEGEILNREILRMIRSDYTMTFPPEAPRTKKSKKKSKGQYPKVQAWLDESFPTRNADNG